MRPDLAGALRCPICRTDGALHLAVAARDAREVREGTLRCAACGAEHAVRRGVAELMPDPPEHVVAEAAGLARFAEHMRNEGWDRERILALPDIPDGYWWVQRCSLQQLLACVPFRPGEVVVDVGANTCWASSRFAELGLRAIALDIALTELQGLYTAEHFFAERGVHFERVLATMDAMPLASGSVDYVYCCEVLHHNDAAGLRRTFAEIFRVLRPGGRLLMVNETLRTLRDRSGVHVDPVVAFDGYEHAYFAHRYRWEAIRAGFSTQVLEPAYRAFFGGTRIEPPRRRWSPAGLAQRFGGRYQDNRVVRAAYLMWLNHVVGGVSMNMVATKPRGRRRRIALRRPR